MSIDEFQLEFFLMFPEKKYLETIGLQECHYVCVKFEVKTIVSPIKSTSL